MAIHVLWSWWWSWDNNSFKAVIVHFVCMGTDYVMGQLYFQLSKAVIVHSVSTVTHHCHVCDGTSPCLHGYTLWWWDDSSKSVTVHVVSMVAPWWWDNNNSKAVIVHFVCMGTDYCDGTTILPRLLLSILCPRLHIIVMLVMVHHHVYMVTYYGDGTIVPSL